MDSGGVEMDRNFKKKATSLIRRPEESEDARLVAWGFSVLFLFIFRVWKKSIT